MNLDYLRYFVKLAEVRHYTKAAELLSISQPSLSHAIRQLEGELGVPLFEKTGRNTALTRFGEEFLACCRRTLSALDEGVASIKRSAKGEGLIRLGFLRVLGSSYIPELASEFMKANPHRNIQFTFHSGRTQELAEGLLNQNYDLVFSSKPSESFNLRSVPVTSQDLVLIVPKDHPLAGQHRADLAETLSYPFIGFSRDSGLREVIDGLYETAGALPRIVLETEEDQVIAGLVSQDFGISVVPYMDLLLKLDLSILQIGYPSCRRDFFMVTSDSLFLPPVARDFRQFVLDRSITGNHK